jgi:phospholipase/lecithinase/hemolysin
MRCVQNQIRTLARPALTISCVLALAATENSYAKTITLPSRAAPPVKVTFTGNIIVLGDSLSDTHNMWNFNRTGYIPNPAAGYYNGRFTNGYNWVDFIGAWVSGKIENYAYGGAQATGKYQVVVPVPNLSQQLDKAIKDHNGKFSPGTIVVIWIGANDILNHPDVKNPGSMASRVSEPIAAATARLRKLGIAANSLFVVCLPPMDRVPYYAQKANAGKKAAAKTAVDTANAQILQLAKKTGFRTVPATDFILRWLNGTYRDVYLKNFTTPCYGGAPGGSIVGKHKAKTLACIDKKSQFEMFFDVLHPTAVAHCGLALLMKRYIVEGGTGLDGFDFAYCHKQKMSPVLPSPDGSAAVRQVARKLGGAVKAGKAGLARAGVGKARAGKAGMVKARLGKAKLGKAGMVKARLGKAKLGKAKPKKPTKVAPSA